MCIRDSSQTAYNAVGAILKSISAKTKDGSPCCTYIGSGGAGHFVKMVHNGIEYTDMQLISEGYYLMRDLLGLSDDETAEVFEQYNCGRLNSYLYEITHKILRFKDKDGKNLIPKNYRHRWGKRNRLLDSTDCLRRRRQSPGCDQFRIHS